MNLDSAGGTVCVIEHPVFFNMEGLSENPGDETRILQGLNDLVHNKFSDLYFLYAGRVLQSNLGVPFTHALISRFPSVEALRTYYDHAITEIAKEMLPWLKKEFGVDYVVEMEEDAAKLAITKDFASHVTFIKVGPNVSDSDIKGAMDAFRGLALESDCAPQLTTGENLYVRESYRTMSHAFSAHFTSVNAMERWQEDSAVRSVLEDIILPLADSFAMVAVSASASSSVDYVLSSKPG